MLRSLWLRLVGAFFGVVAITIALLLAGMLAQTQMALGELVTGTTLAVQALLSQAGSTGPPLEVVEVLIPDERAIAAGNTAQGSPANEVVAGPAPVVTRVVPRTLPEVVQSAASQQGNQMLRQVRRAALVSAVAAGAFATILGTWIVRGITRPLYDLRAAAQSVARGDLGTRVSAESRDEIGQLATAFNQMAAGLEHQEKLRQQMVADVAHELRTPLSIVRGDLEAMLDKLVSPDPEELGQMHEEIMRLTRLVEDLRLLSQADAGKLRIGKEVVDIGDLVEDVVRQMTPLARAAGLRLSACIGQSTCQVVGDRDKLHRALANLVDNAIRYTPEGGSVAVDVKRTASAVQVAVTDTGVGIPADQQSQVFERFWRGDLGRARDQGGSGLGLAIVKEIVQAHGGEATVESAMTGGTSFALTLPRLQGDDLRTAYSSNARP